MATLMYTTRKVSLTGGMQTILADDGYAFEDLWMLAEKFQGEEDVTSEHFCHQTTLEI